MRAGFFGCACALRLRMTLMGSAGSWIRLSSTPGGQWRFQIFSIAEHLLAQPVYGVDGKRDSPEWSGHERAPQPQHHPGVDRGVRDVAGGGAGGASQLCAARGGAEA